jgi:hypothetical protein
MRYIIDIHRADTGVTVVAHAGSRSGRRTRIVVPDVHRNDVKKAIKMALDNCAVQLANADKPA